MNLLYEHTFKITVYDLGIEIRCWVQADGHEEKTSGYYAKAVLREVNEHKAKLKELDIAIRRTEIATLVTKAIPEMNTIEVVSIESRHGVVVYKALLHSLGKQHMQFFF